MHTVLYEYLEINTQKRILRKESVKSPNFGFENSLKKQIGIFHVRRLSNEVKISNFKECYENIRKY